MAQPFPNPIGGFNTGFQTGFNMARAKAQDKMQADIVNLNISLQTMSNKNLPDATKLEIYNTIYKDSMSKLSPATKIEPLKEWPDQLGAIYQKGYNLTQDESLSPTETIKQLGALELQGRGQGLQVDFSKPIKRLQEEKEQKLRQDVVTEAGDKVKPAAGKFFAETGKTIPKGFIDDNTTTTVADLKGVIEPQSILDFITTGSLEGAKALDIKETSKDKSIEWFINEIGEFKKKKASLVARQDIMSDIFRKEAVEESVNLIDKQIEKLEGFAETRFGKEWIKFQGKTNPLNLDLDF